MTTGLSINDLVTCTVSLSAISAATRNFGALLIVGASTSIDTTERIRSYASLSAVASDFSGSSGEYLAAANFFAQSPTPSSVQIGRWAQSATAASIKGGALSAAEQLLSAWTGITTGSTRLTIDGTLKTLSPLTFATCTTMTAVAAVINTALGVAGSCVWNSVYSRFEITSATTGASSTITYASATGSGVDITAQLRLSAASGSNAPVAGMVAESLLAAYTALSAFSNNWYGAMTASTLAANADHVAVAGFIEALSPSHIYGATTTESGAKSAGSTTDLAYLLKAGLYKRTFCQYSATDANACASIFGRTFTVNFDGQNTTLTVKFKTEPGIVAETLTEAEATALGAKNCNVYVNYNNGTAIVQEGKMCSGDFFDEIHGLDWLQNRIQADVVALLTTSTTKIPQTDAGMNQIAACVSNACDAAVNNGLFAPGIWTGPNLGAIKTGQTLSKGYYLSVGSLAAQSAVDRAARKATPIQVIAKLAGAVHSANVAVNVVR